MGVGRRMKKQGPPEPLSEEHFAKLKRKAGLPVDDVAPSEDAPSKKRRKRSSQGAAAVTPQKASSTPAKTKTTTKTTTKTGDVTKVAARANGKPNSTKAALPSSKYSKSKSKSRRSDPALESADEEENMSDGLGEGFGDSDVVVDEFSGLGKDDENDGEVGLGDDFLGSDDSVYDSDKDAQQRAMFSEDEGDSDAEEKLTAANIAGLSRKLDEQQAREDAEAQAELEEAAMQTNIIGDADRPRILPDGQEEGGNDLVLKTKGLLAPDLQMLRSRINETIRVLDDIKLAEEGRSRAEYTSQLLKDICAYCKGHFSLLDICPRNFHTYLY